MKILFIIFAIVGLISAATLGTCKYNTPDMVTQILPNYTSPVQPCSYSGFAPLDSQNQSAIFYWYFPHQSSTPDIQVPLLLWLQGGPGTSDMFGLFLEDGPFKLSENSDGGYSIYNMDATVGQSWAYNFNMLYIDSPVGVGFSYTANGNYSKNETDVAYNAWLFMQYFTNLHPETVNLKWYISGESYGGRYIPAVTYWSIIFNDEIASGQRTGQKINIQGIMIGDGLIHGLNQRIHEAEVAIASSVIAPYQAEQMYTLNVNCEIGVSRNISTKACSTITTYMDDLSGLDALAVDMPGNITDNIGVPIVAYFSNSALYSILHVENSKKTPIYEYKSAKAKSALSRDVLFDNALFYVNYLLTRIPCLFFNGVFDDKDGGMSGYGWLPLLADPYPKILNEVRNIWWYQGLPAGFYTTYGNLTYSIIDYAGHFVPYFVLNTSVEMVKIFTMQNNDWNPYKNSTPVAQLMCSNMKSCHGNGTCNSQGICECNTGYGFADCSQKAVDISYSSITLNFRDYSVLRVNFTGKDRVLQISGDNGYLKLYYTGTRNGPVAEESQADLVYFATPGNTNPRAIYLPQANSGTGYLTIHNTNYLAPVTFLIKNLTNPTYDSNILESKFLDFIDM